MRSSTANAWLDRAKRIQALDPGERISATRSTSSHEVAELDRRVSDPELLKVVRSRFSSGHYADAVEAAAKYLVSLVGDLSGLEGDADGTGLMTTAFSSRKPVLRVNSGRTRTDSAEQLGYMHLCAGVVSAFRNPRAHRADIEDSPAGALMRIELIDHLAAVARGSLVLRQEDGEGS
jgi:uncharacterized protein (TIGR02391 family)